MSDPLVTPVRAKSLAHAVSLLRDLGAEQRGVEIMAPKAIHHLFRIAGLDVRAGNILKQVALSKGGECATPRSIINRAEGSADVILMGTRAQVLAVCDNLAYQPFGLKKVREQLLVLLDRLEAGPGVWKLRGRELELARTIVMGIVNVTPDSFSDPGRYERGEDAVEAAMRMETDGADIVDVGGESTRPGAAPVDEHEELERVLPVLEGLKGRISIPISIDTSKPGVARAAIEAGAAIVNDVTAFAESEMVRLAAESGAGCVLMHMKGEPRTMQEKPAYDDVMGEISAFLTQRADRLLEAGVDRRAIVLDPGIGFGKTTEHNLEIFDRLGELAALGFPVLVGPSRKRFIGEVLGTDIDERLEGTAAAVSYAILRGARIVRVHDVREMARVVRMTDTLREGKSRG
ncbi:MAG: dihydropteroate synthase [Actinobacteria bacterium]|nr:MAG: dihydropteroate synthase [Actinomycetota bacterium]